ncbi:hypothetical protein TNCV_5010171 [Trichonephila clavipes]|nr:hypothetical protein TNCV_5010171 [Trichonephila clavipes]
MPGAMNCEGLNRWSPSGYGHKIRSRRVAGLSPEATGDPLRREVDACAICSGSKSSHWRDVVAWRGSASSGVMLATLPWFKIPKSVAHCSRVAL